MKVGMLRFSKNPTVIAKTVAFVCGHYNIDFFYFTPEDVDLTHQTINGQFLINGKWVHRTTYFPDVIDNALMRKQDEFLYSVLGDRCVLTTRRIGSKQKISQMLEDDGNFKDILIPQKIVKSESDINPFIDKYNKVLLKPSRGNRGQDIYVIYRGESGFQISTDTTSEYYSEADFSTLFNKLFLDRLYICQPFIESKTKEGHPFDVRIHTRKNENGKWSTVKMYPRIGIGHAITSNISQGGGISEINPFLKSQFDAVWENVKIKLNQLSKSFPAEFQSFYKFSIDALAIDLGIDKSGKLWLFEVNTFPGAKFFEIQDSEARVQYYKYCAKKVSQTV